MRQTPDLLHRFLKHLTECLITYVRYQIASGDQASREALMKREFMFCEGAQVVQLFDSWAHHLSPDQFQEFSLPYVEEIIQAVKAHHPEVPLIFHMNGGTGKLGMMDQCSADIIGLDWQTDTKTARDILGNRTVQVND